jgi:hypothetical protein
MQTFGYTDGIDPGTRGQGNTLHTGWPNGRNDPGATIVAAGVHAEITHRHSNRGGDL